LESVSEDHPDKLADRISVAVLDEFLRHDPTARVACETLLADQCVIVGGEFKTRNPRRVPASSRTHGRDSLPESSAMLVTTAPPTGRCTRRMKKRPRYAAYADEVAGQK